MRTAFIRAVTGLAARDGRIWLVCGDLGFSVLEEFAAAFPDRFVNVGVAEQNMTGIAAGLALSGKIVFTYSIANFPTMRCLEQIRNDVCYHNLNVKIVAVGGGLSYGPQGYTHHGVEDLGVMRLLPNLSVFAPADPIEASLVAGAIASRPGPCYVRLGKSGERKLYSEAPGFEVGKAIRVVPGTDVSIIAIGGVLDIALAAARSLREYGCSAEVASMPTLEPLDDDYIYNAAARTGALVTVEEHGPGGLGSAVAELLAIAGSSARLGVIRLPKAPSPVAGSQEILRRSAGLAPEGIVSVALKLRRDPQCC